MCGLRVEDRWPVDAIREAVESSDLSLAQICVRLGWVYPNGQAATERLSRAIGRKPQSEGLSNRNMRYDTAVAIVRALDLDPVDVGL